MTRRLRLVVLLSLGSLAGCATNLDVKESGEFDPPEMTLDATTQNDHFLITINLEWYEEFGHVLHDDTPSWLTDIYIRYRIDGEVKEYADERMNLSAWKRRGLSRYEIDEDTRDPANREIVVKIRPQRGAEILEARATVLLWVRRHDLPYEVPQTEGPETVTYFAPDWR